MTDIVLLYVTPEHRPTWSPLDTNTLPEHFADTLSYTGSLTKKTVSSDSRRLLLNGAFLPPLAGEHELESLHTASHLVHHFFLH